MSTRLDSLAQERRALVDEIGRSRHELSRAAQRVGPPLRRLEKLQRDARYIRQNYGLLLLPVALLVILNPGRTLRLALTAWTAWVRVRGLRAP